MSGTPGTLSVNKRTGIRPIKPAQDMPVVLDLIEEGFRTELDPQGWKMLDRLRHLYGPGQVGRAIVDLAEGTTGFVWEEDGEIVGNLSIRRALPPSTRGRLIGNVVVRPDFRGRGIGRALMEAALDEARRQGARWVGLEVRADNEVACGLYRRLGFHTVGQTRHLLRPNGIPWPRIGLPKGRWRRSKPTDASIWLHLAQAVYDPSQRWVLEVRPDLYTFGSWGRSIALWLSKKQEQAWLCGETAAVHVAVERRYRFHVWEVLLHPRVAGEQAAWVVDRCVRSVHRWPPWPVVLIVADMPPLVEAMYAVGFRLHRTLQQMILEL